MDRSTSKANVVDANKSTHPSQTGMDIQRKLVCSPFGCTMDKTLSPINPGEVLLEDFMKSLKLTQYRSAKDIGVPSLHINQIVHGKRSSTVDTAIGWHVILGRVRAFGCDCRRAMILRWQKRALGKRIKREVKVSLRPTAGL